MNLKQTQAIEFSPDEDDNSVEIYAEDVSITASTGKHHTGSSKVKLNNVVVYNWEEKFYHGQLITVQNMSKYIAYAIRAVTKQNTSIIRIVNRITSKRGIIKDLNGIIEDLAFADTVDEVLLASVDHNGTVLVHSIDEVNGEIDFSLVLHITENSLIPVPVPHRIIWCSYISDYDPPNWAIDHLYGEVSRNLAVTRNNKIELWNVKTVREHYGRGPLSSAEVTDGFVQIDAHTKHITDAAFSPDGSAIATASLDGQCKFYQVYRHSEGSARCLHQWEPHAGKPLSSLFFLDDHRNFSPSAQFWKFALTGADNNSELKLWSCETWKCIQTIRFVSKFGTAPLKLKAQMDAEAGFVILSDISHRVLYILQLKKPVQDSTNPYICSISEFKFASPVLSFGIVDAQEGTAKANSSFSMEDICNDKDDEGVPPIFIRMYVVQPKALQECHIAFQTGSGQTKSSFGREQNFNNDFNEISESLSAAMELNNSSSDVGLGSGLPLNLMTPEAFSSPAKNSDDDKEEPERDSCNLITNSAPLSPSKDHIANYSDQLFPDNVVPGVALLTSGGSSPSREVQEILSVKGGSSVTDFYLDTPELKPESTTWPKTSPLVPTKSVASGTNSGTLEPKLDLLTKAVNIAGIEASVNNLNETIMKLQYVIHQQGKLIQDLTHEVKRRDELLGPRTEETIKKWWDGQRPAFRTELSQVSCSINQEQLTLHLTRSIQHMVVQELNKIVPAALKVTLDRLVDTMETELVKKISSTEHILRDNFNKLVKNKSIIDALTATMINNITPAMGQCYKESFVQAVPICEKMCENMFSQIKATFAQGTEQYIKEMEAYCEQISEQNKQEKLVLTETSDKVAATSQQLVSNLEKLGKSLEDSLTQSVARAIRGTLNNGSVIPRSRTVTPAPSLRDAQALLATISGCITQGQYETAFQTALSAADLTLVMYVCDKVPPHMVFTQSGSLLPQFVLLSLVQQLSADMTHYNETKHRYLEEAVMNLDQNHSATREHMPNVLTTLRKNLQLFVQNHPSNPMTRRVRMLLMAIQSLLS